MKQKPNLISTLVHRALVICSKSSLQNELSNICSIPINNGYPEAAINTVITKKINWLRRPTQWGLKKCPVYLHLPWLDNVLMRYKMQINHFTLQSGLYRASLTRHSKNFTAASTESVISRECFAASAETVCKQQ